MKILGFTGSRRGMTPAQRNTVHCFLTSLPDLDSVVHGGAIGADATFDQLARHLNIERLILPSNIPSQTMADQGSQWLAPQPPLTRNHNIVDACSFMLATPAEYSEIVRSGTWATIRYARRQRIPVYIIWPDGRIEV